MKNILLSLIFTLPFIVVGQTEKVKEPWEIGCDTMETQADMNICSYESYQIADSILTSLYSELESYFNQNLLEEQKNINSKEDTTHNEYIAQIERQIKTVEKSKSDFYKMLSSTTEIMGIQYEGGSMRPLVLNLYSLQITVNQINLLRIMLEETKM